MTKKLNFVLVSQRVENIIHRKEIRDCIDQKLIQWLIQNEFIPIPNPNFKVSENLIMKYLNELLRKINPIGIVLSGGNNIGECKYRDLIEDTLLRISVKKKIPVLGICRGFQFMNSFLSGEISEIKNHVNKPHTLKLTSKHYHALRDIQMACKIEPLRA